jgi:hypothetical protein
VLQFCKQAGNSRRIRPQIPWFDHDFDDYDDPNSAMIFRNVFEVKRSRHMRDV